MNSSMRPELTACVDNSASLQTRPSSLIYRGLTVQTNRATSVRHLIVMHQCLRSQSPISNVFKQLIHRLQFLDLQGELLLIS